MRATEEAAFWLYSAKDWIDGMNAFVLDRLKAYALSMACELLLKYCIVINGGSPPEAHSHVLLAQEVGKLGRQVPKMCVYTYVPLKSMKLVVAMI